MGLFINSNEHPDVYKFKGEIKEPNQGFLRIDYFSELVKKQQRVNDSLMEALAELKSLHLKQKDVQAIQWQEVESQLNELKESNVQHGKFEDQAMGQLRVLDNKNLELQSIIDSEREVNKDILKKVNTLKKSNNDIIKQIKSYEAANKEIISKIQEVFDISKEMSEKVSNQDANHNKVLSQLENQGALMEKSLRQINHLRSVIYERANDLADKIENSYKLTSSYLYKMITGSDQPLTLLMTQQKEKHKKAD